MKLVFTLYSLLFFLTVSAQKIDNVHYEQSAKTIIVIYDLSDLKSGQTATVSLFYSEDGGNTWSNALSNVTGDVGKNISSGTNKKITWNVLLEREQLKGEVKFKVKAEVYIASANSTPYTKSNFSADYKKYKKQKTFWLTSSVATGGIATYAYLQSEKFHKQYLTHATDVGLQKKIEFYDQIIPFTIGASLFCTLKFIIKSDKYKKAKKQSLGLYPVSLNKGAGILAIYNF